ncbi:MAG: helix-turn-helix domain-containing protein [Nitrospira sp.]
MVASTFSLDQAHSNFLAALPRIALHARISFRQIRCSETKSDCISEVTSLCWKWWLRILHLGKDPSTFVSTIADYAVRAVRSGRRLCGTEKAKDVLSPSAQRRHNFTVQRLPDFATLTGNELTEALHDNTRSSVPDQVQFRMDFPAWLVTHTARNRKIVVEMAKGERTQVLARKFGVSPARVSQLRRELHEGWQKFTEDKWG